MAASVPSFRLRELQQSLAGMTIHRKLKRQNYHLHLLRERAFEIDWATLNRTGSSYVLLPANGRLSKTSLLLVSMGKTRKEERMTRKVGKKTDRQKGRKKDEKEARFSNSEYR